MQTAGYNGAHTVIKFFYFFDSTTTLETRRDLKKKSLVFGVFEEKKRKNSEIS